MQELNKIEDDLKFFNIYLSYCWYDQNVVEKIADLISEMGFNVLFDNDDEKLKLNIFNAIYKSDLILLCLSESYLKCFSCQKEAKYCFEKKIPTLALSIEENFVPDKWLSKIIAGRQYTKLVRPIEYLHSKSMFCKKLNEIYSRMQYHKIIDFRNEKRFPKQDEIVKKRKLYDQKLDLLTKKEQKAVNEEKQKIEKLFVNDGMIDELKNDLPIIYRWYIKLPNVTLSNIVPFTPTGDINDAVFPYPPEQLELIQSCYKCKGSSSGRGNTLSHFNTHNTVNLCWLSAQYDKLIAEQQKNTPDKTHEYFAKLIERNFRLNTTLGDNYIWRSYVGFPEDRTEEEMELRKKLDNNLNIKQKRRVNLSKYFNERYKNCPEDTFCKFAKQLFKNKQEFEAFYEKNNFQIILPNF